MRRRCEPVGQLRSVSASVIKIDHLIKIVVTVTESTCRARRAINAATCPSGHRDKYVLDLLLLAGRRSVHKPMQEVGPPCDTGICDPF
jgi:hypothetical protein